MVVCRSGSDRGTYIKQECQRVLKINWVLSLFGWNMRVTKCCQQHGFEALLKRWIVERTFAKLSQSRRLGKNHEVTVLFS